MTTLLLALLSGEGGRLLQTTLQVGLLVVVILGVKVLVGRRLPARWHAALWLTRPTLSSRRLPRLRLVGWVLLSPGFMAT